MSGRVVRRGEKIVPLNSGNFNQVRYEEPSGVTIDMALMYTILKKYSAFLLVQSLMDEGYKNR
jgi:hypothetical protein